MSFPSQNMLLPMPVQTSEPRHAAGIHVPFPVFLYDPMAGQYTVLAPADGDSDSEDGTVAGDDGLAKSNADTYATDLESLQVDSAPVTVAPKSFSWYRAIADTIWYIRMCLLLMILCTAVTLATGTVFALIGNLIFLGSFEPYSTMLAKGGNSETKACAAGAAVLGCVVGLLAFARLVVRRALMTAPERKSERATVDEYEYAASPAPREPQEVWGALTVAALAGVFAMAVGMAIVPGLTTDEFGVRHALAVGAWGLGAPLTPVLVCMIVATLWKCDPCAGAECCCEGVGACCVSD